MMINMSSGENILHGQLQQDMLKKFMAQVMRSSVSWWWWKWSAEHIVHTHTHHQHPEMDFSNAKFT